MKVGDIVKSLISHKEFEFSSYDIIRDEVFLKRDDESLYITFEQLKQFYILSAIGSPQNTFVAKFNPGDKVRALNSYGFIVKDQIYTVANPSYRQNGLLNIEDTLGNLAANEADFELHQPGLSSALNVGWTSYIPNVLPNIFTTPDPGKYAITLGGGNFTFDPSLQRGFTDEPAKPNCDCGARKVHGESAGPEYHAKWCTSLNGSK